MVVANFLHREMVEGLVAAGKHVLCEKPLSDNLEDARAMADLARSADTVVRIGFTFRRAPGVAALRELVTSGALGRILHVDGRYWCDYASDPKGPMSWRYKGAPGSGALADIGSHVALSRRVPRRRRAGGERRPVRDRDHGASGAARHRRRSRPSRGERHLRAGRERRLRQPSAPSSSDGVGVVQVSRVAAGHPNGLALRGVRRERRREVGAGACRRSSSSCSNEGPSGTRGYRRVIIGPDHPYFAGGLPMDAPGVGVGQNDGFAFQARAFLEEVAGIDEADSLPRSASFDEGVHNMEILAAVAESAANGGASGQGRATARRR